jgi:hypothetical protein
MIAACSSTRRLVRGLGHTPDAGFAHARTRLAEKPERIRAAGLGRLVSVRLGAGADPARLGGAAPFGIPEPSEDAALQPEIVL